MIRIPICQVVAVVLIAAPLLHADGAGNDAPAALTLAVADTSKGVSNQERPHEWGRGR
jgi:hypothetical protein